VEDALVQSLEAGRERLRWLVSRDVTTLSATQVRESAIETLAENLNDSVVAPLFWFALLGLPGAALYRFANTADAMWGYPGVYKGQNWAWAGKFAARVDDVLSWMPARITALVLLLAGALMRLRDLRLAVQLPAEAARTPSPNSGWPMAAMALVLGVGLRKPGVYMLNAQGGEAGATDTRQALRVGDRALWMFATLGCALVLWLKQCLFAWVQMVQLFAASGVNP
jgi:adenosylcobinamide-phosphate synthase